MYSFDEISKKLPELMELKKLLEDNPKVYQSEIIASVPYNDNLFPIHAVTLGNPPKNAPTFILTGGVHGLERIGTRVILAYLQKIARFAQWDPHSTEIFNRMRLVVIPIINPVGMFLGRRSNSNGVDLMRNAPVNADPKSTRGLIAGHRISNRIPWYRGVENAAMELEAQALCDYVLKISSQTEMTLCLDVHSGFGARDRIWFPYAKSREPFPNVAEVLLLQELLNSTLSHHIYKIEPQSLIYTTHGDLWDYMYDGIRTKTPQKFFLPMTLELGSWLWVKKHPIQMFSAAGIFNPVQPHRQKRILRRHMHLLDFLVQAVAANENWLKKSLK